jgi:hypothetical protein
VSTARTHSTPEASILVAIAGNEDQALARGVFFPSRSEIAIHRDWRLTQYVLPWTVLTSMDCIAKK